MNKYTKKLFLLVFAFITAISLFAFSGCKKEKAGEDSESGIIVVTEEVFNKNVKSPISGISRFSVKALSEYDEKYLVEEQRYYALAFLKETDTHKLTVNFSGASAIDDQIFVMSRDGSERLEITKEENSYTGALDGITVDNTAHNKKSDYYVAVGFTLYEGFGEEINVSVDSYFNVGGSENWEDSVRCQKQSAYKKHVKTQSSVKFISDTDYKSGDIDAKLKDSLPMTVGEKYYAVIDFKLYDPVGITENDRASIRINVKDENAVWENGVLVTNRLSFDIEDFPTSYHEKNATGFDASFFLAFNSEGVANYRFIVLVNPYDTVKVNVDAALVADKISFVLESKPSGSISTGEGDGITRSLEYQLSADKSFYSVVGLGNENRDRINIPATYNGLPVKEIAAETFNGVKYLKEVKIPYGVEMIGKNAFAGCVGLKFIVIPSSVAVISENAFNDCNLNIFYVGTTVPTGWHSEFNPEKLTVFTDCKKSAGDFSFTLNSDGISYTVSGGNCKAKRIIIPAVYGDYPVTHVASGLYNFIGITLPESVVSVEEGALKNTDDLTYACISASARSFINTDKLKWLEIKGKTLPSGAFKNCALLTSVILSDTVTDVGNEAFYGCSELTAVTFGGVQSIGNSAFYGCKKLSALELPGSVTTIGDYAFSGCAALPRITLGNNVTSLGKYAFEYCSSVKEISIGTGISVIPEGAFRYVKSLNLFTVPAHITAIDKFAFYGCHGLVSVDITKVWLDYIGEKAFYDCISLIEVVQEYNYVTKGSTQNGYLGYYVDEIHRTSCVKQIGDYLFYVYQPDITYITRYLVKYTGEGGDITLPESYNGLSYPVYKYAFYDIDTLREVTVKGKVTEIGDYAFYDCDKIDEISVSGDVQSIGKYAFYGCDNLFRVKLEGSVQTVLNSAFEDCKELFTVTLGDSIETLSDRAFYGCGKLFKVYFGTSSLASELYYIGVSAFEGCASLSGVIELPGEVSKIKDRAFYGCKSITEIKIKNLVDTIGNEVFDGCTALEKITVSDANMDYMSEDGVLYCIKNGKVLVKYPEGKTA